MGRKNKSVTDGEIRYDVAVCLFDSCALSFLEI